MAGDDARQGASFHVSHNVLQARARVPVPPCCFSCSNPLGECPYDPTRDPLICQDSAFKAGLAVCQREKSGQEAAENDAPNCPESGARTIHEAVVRYLREGCEHDPRAQFMFSAFCDRVALVNGGRSTRQIGLPPWRVRAALQVECGAWGLFPNIVLGLDERGVECLYGVRMRREAEDEGADRGRA